MIYNNQTSKDKIISFYDKKLLFVIVGLSITGFIMVASASISFGIRLYNDPFYFTKRNFLYFFISFYAFFQVLKYPTIFWENYSKIGLLSTLFLLCTMFLYGDNINGAIRWISIGSLHFQPSEWSKLVLFFYISHYISRKHNELKNTFWGFCKPIIITLIFIILLLIQPDLGNALILFFTTLILLFLVGIKLWQFFSIFLFGLLTIIILIIYKPYRIRRILAFWNPWNDPFDSGYQITQSLMAFGRGKIFGTGLGNSIQKLEYLPEAHTDFIFSVLGEELGYLGSILILFMIFFMSIRILYIGKRSLTNKNQTSGYFSYAIGTWLSLQAIMNIGGVVGILPVKGLTLPLISYGGSSLITVLLSLAFVLRLDFELRLKKYQAFIL
ncbi:MAG: cell division protein FtsW [Wigglesworthia glossinidia]|nr:cell division protein FtsW [Wigglesworthia glossinidia]